MAYRGFLRPGRSALGKTPLPRSWTSSWICHDLISDSLPFGCLWYDGPNAVGNAIGYAEHYSRAHDAVIRVYDAAGNVIETHEHKGDFKEW
jgi:hypothetical protein